MPCSAIADTLAYSEITPVVPFRSYFRVGGYSGAAHGWPDIGTLFFAATEGLIVSCPHTPKTFGAQDSLLQQMRKSRTSSSNR